MQALSNRLLLLHVVLVSAFLLAPIVIAVLISFSSASDLAFPPPGLSLEWYRAAWENHLYTQGFAASTAIALLSTLIAGCAGTLAAVAINNHVFPGRTAFRTLIMLPLVVPAIISGLGMMQLLAKLDIGPGWLVASLGHAVISLPYVTYLVLASLSNYDVRLEQAALTLGASQWRVFWSITLPLIRPGVTAGCIFALLVSFDQVSISLFLTRGDPLPLRLMQQIQYYADPSVAAVSMVLVVLSLVALAFSGRMLQRRDLGNMQ